MNQPIPVTIKKDGVKIIVGHAVPSETDPFTFNVTIDDEEVAKAIHGGVLGGMSIGGGIEILQEPPPLPLPVLPHSRACGPRPHNHGSACHNNCPTCGGRDNAEVKRGI